MIGVSRYSAVFSRHIPEISGLDHIEIVGALKSGRTEGPAARYACHAFELMNPDVDSLGLVTISGASGSTVNAFDRAWRLSEDGELTGPGFGEKRYKRIHPFTLVQSLQNQVPAALSMNYKITGPCLNLLDAATGLAYALPNISQMLQRCARVLLVMASAGDREEETTKLKGLEPNSQGLEGAICLLLEQDLTRDRALGYLEAGTGEASSACEIASPVLSGGLGILLAVATRASRRITLNDYFGNHASIYWRRT